MNAVFALAALPLGGLWWHFSAREARVVNHRSGNIGWWLGAIVGLAAAILVLLVPLRPSALIALPLIVGLGIAIVTDVLETSVYDSVSLGLLVYSVIVALVSRQPLVEWIGLPIYGGIALALVLWGGPAVFGLADVYGIAMLGVLFGRWAFIEIAVALVASGLIMAVVTVIRRRAPMEFPFFPGIAIAVVFGLSPLLGWVERYCAGLVSG